MSHDSHDAASFYRYDSAMDQENTRDFSKPVEPAVNVNEALMTQLLQQLVVGQQRQNELLEDLTKQMNAAQRQRAVELGQWKQANPHLARSCRKAVEALSQVQTEFLRNLTDEVQDNADGLIDSDYALTDFVDRYGPRMAHLNSVLQMLSQLSSVPGQTSSNQA